MLRKQTHWRLSGADTGLPARLLFWTLNLIYGKRRTLSKFKVLELIARVPYQSWEQTAYIAITHVHERTGMARRIYERVLETRAQQDNEQWHLLILDEQITQSGIAEGRIKYFWIPQLIAVTYCPGQLVDVCIQAKMVLPTQR